MRRFDASPQLSAIGTSMFTVVGLLRRHGPMTRSELIAATGYGRKVITQRVDELMQSGLVTDRPVPTTHAGRPAAEVLVRPESGHVLVGEVTPSAVRAGISDLSGQLLHWRGELLAYELGPDRTIGRIEELWREMLGSGEGYRVRAIGMSVLGAVDQVTGIMEETLGDAAWHDYPLREQLQARFGVPVWVDNEANMTAVGEIRRHRADDDSFLFVRVADGIGGAVFSGGHLHRGAAGVAGEIGHIRVVPQHGRPCWCGGSGCLVTVAGTAAIEDAVNTIAADELGSDLRGVVPYATFDTILSAALAGDRVAASAIARAGAATGQALAHVANILNPSDIVVGGSLVGAGALFAEPLREALRDGAIPSASASLRVSFSDLDDSLGLVGSAITAVDGLLSPEFADHWLPPDIAGTLWAVPRPDTAPADDKEASR